MTAAVVVALLAWGTLTAIDLVSVGQVMIARPLVAGTVAGVLLGDAAAGALVGGVLELFALEILAVGGARYPDYGPGAVAGAAVVAHAPVELALGVGVAAGLLLAWLGQASIGWLRRGTTRAVRARLAELAAGDRRILARLHLGGAARDALRGLVLTGLGLAAAAALRAAPTLGARPALALSVGLVGAAVGTGAAAAWRLAAGPRLRGVLAGIVVGGIAWTLW